jgi:hypothetical protein
LEYMMVLNSVNGKKCFMCLQLSVPSIAPRPLAGEGLG